MYERCSETNLHNFKNIKGNSKCIWCGKTVIEIMSEELLKKPCRTGIKMNYDQECPDCKKTTLCSTTDDDLENYTELECPWCGRVSDVVDHEVTFIVKQTGKKVSPTELEKLESLKHSGQGQKMDCFVCGKSCGYPLCDQCIRNGHTMDEVMQTDFKPYKRTVQKRLLEG